MTDNGALIIVAAISSIPSTLAALAALWQSRRTGKAVDGVLQKDRALATKRDTAVGHSQGVRSEQRRQKRGSK